jgi:Mn2+/Fe2+ NRAMP family transporter
MGEYRNGRWLNAVAGATTIVMIALTVYLVFAGVKDLLA